MAPTLSAGDYLVVDLSAYRARLPATGNVVVVHDPRDPSRQLVKRVAAVNLDGSLWLTGDNPSASTDSRSFGWVTPASVRGRVLFRYYPRLARL